MSAAGGAFRPHDLLWADDASALRVEGEWPCWATPEWLAAAPVVVRRAMPAAAELVAIGLRGTARGERCAGHLRSDQVRRVVTPEQLARRVATGAASALPCLQALARVGPALDALPLAWGVTGGVGFALASGLASVLRTDSDLDLLVRASCADAADALHAVFSLLAQRDARIDVQVETPQGAFALAEWARTGGAVLLKTASGPRLVADPWQADLA